MAVTVMSLLNLSEDVVWQMLQEELTTLLDDLLGDPKYIDRVILIRALPAHPECLL